MKRAVIVLFIFLSFASIAQDKLIYTEVVKVDSSIKKEELFSRARSWFNSSFNKSQNVLNIQDKESGELSGTAIIRYVPNVYVGSSVTTGKISYVISVKVKDGRYKYQVTDFIHYGSPSSIERACNFDLIMKTDTFPRDPYNGQKRWCDKVWADIRKQIDSSIQPLIFSLKTNMGRPAKEDDNW